MRLFAHSPLVSDAREFGPGSEEVLATLPGGVTSLGMHHLKHDTLGTKKATLCHVACRLTLTSASIGRWPPVASSHLIGTDDGMLGNLFETARIDHYMGRHSHGDDHRHKALNLSEQLRKQVTG